MSETKARVIQYVFIITTLIILAVGGWWYYQKSQASTKFQSPQTGSLTNGLQGYWTLDGGAIVWADTTSEVKDVSGNARHINLQIGGDAPTEVPGRLGQGFRFPTTAGTVGIAPSVFDSYTTGTIAMWIKYSGTVGETPTSGTLWGYDNCTSNRGQFQLAMDMQNSTIYLWMTASGSSCTATVDASVTLPNPTDWHHVVFTDDTSGHKLYIDGVLQTLTYTTGSASTDFFFDNITGTAGEQQIGTMNNENFSGTLDEIRLYNRALSATEVASLYDLGKVTANLRPGDDVLEEGLSGYWKLDDGSGSSATDASGNGNTLSLTASPTWTTGQIGGGIDFDGSTQYAGVADPASGVLDVPDGADVTVTGWFNRDTATTEDTIVAKRNSSATNTDAGYIVWIDATNDKLNFTVGDGGGTASDQYTLASASTFTATGWHHFVAVWHDAKGIDLYIDGRLDNSTASSTASIGNLGNAVDFRIAAESDAGNPFDGKIDEVRTYHRALSPDEARRLYQETHPDDPNTNLVGYWTFDGTDVRGAAALDRSRATNNGTLTNGPTVAPGRLGQSLNFDDADDYVAVADPTSGALDFGSGQAFSLAGWFYRDTNGTMDALLFKASNDLSQGYGLLFDGNLLTAFLNDASDDCGWYVNVGDITGVWHHYVLSVDSSHVATLYLDGTNIGSNDCSIAGDLSNGDALAIGIGYAGTTIPFDGKLDDVRIYDTALTQAQVTDIYQASGGKTTLQSSQNGVLTNGLVGQWSFDGPSVAWNDTTTEVKDTSGNANHGDAIGMSAASATPGRIGQALSFDGSSARVDLFTDPVFDNLDAKTISAWIKPSGLTQYRAVMGRTTWAFQICSNDATDCNGTAGHLVYYHAFSGTDGKWRLGADSVLADQWAHVVVTYDRTSTTNDPVVYVNGISQTVTELSAPTGTADSETNDLSIGYDGYVNAAGQIDDVRLYNRGLSPSEVTQLYNMGR